MCIALRINFYRFSIAILTLLIALSITNCNSCKGKQQGELVAKQLAEAQHQAKQMAGLLQLKRNTPEYEAIIDKWEQDFIKYFEEKEKLTGARFFTNSLSIADDTRDLVEGYHKTINNSTKWCPILGFRNILTNMLNAMAALDSNSHTQQELASVLKDVASIKGGCVTGFCHNVNEADIDSETKKMQRILEGIEKILPKIKTYNEQAYAVEHEAVKIGINAIHTFRKKTNNFDKNLVFSERANIFYEYVRSATLFTITLKVLSENNVSTVK
mgnify:CR=1 FL=1